MESLVLIATVLLTVVTALPPPLPGRDYGDLTIVPFESRLEDFPDTLVHQNDTSPFSFRYVWLDQRGNEFPSKRPNTVEIAFTAGVSATGQRKCLYILKHMMWYMPPYIFTNIAAYTKVGVFTRFEKITAFPEFARHRDTPQCRGRCDNECKVTCTFDGRKYESLAGAGGRRGVAVESNTLCDRYDPYGGQMNVLVHEFTHTIHIYALSQDTKDQITAAYNRAKQYNIWRKGSYALSTVYEYWAEGAGVFLNTDKYVSANGGMSNCWDRGPCRDVADARRWMQYKDAPLFNLLNFVYTNNGGYLSRLRPCV